MSEQPKDVPAKEIESLIGKVDKKAMGQRDQKQKPKRAAKANKKNNDSFNISFKGGNILEQKFDETLIYRPKTQQNKTRYENFLGRLNRIVQDLPQDTLISVADEVLAILKGTQNDIQKKLSMEAILGEKIDQESFLDLINVVKTITDYKIQQNQDMEEEIAIGDEDEDEDNEDSADIMVEEQEVEQQEEDDRDLKKNQSQKDTVKEEPTDNKLDPNSIDAHWLHLQLSKYFEPTEAQRMENEVLFALSSETKLEAENNLLSLLNYDQYELIKLLLDNRQVIYYCTRYHKSQNDKQKEQILEDMKLKNINITGKKNNRSAPAQIKRENDNDMENENDENLHIAELAKEQQIHRINKKMIDLNIHDSTERVSSKQEYKFKLPVGATKNLKQGYEEVYIPPSVDKKQEKLIDIESLPSWMQPVFTGIKKLNTIQSRVHDHTLNSDKNMLVCAPTSAGKTNIALMSILRVVSHYINKNGGIDTSKFKIVYIAPMKALVSEITGNLSNRLSCLGINVRELTGDMNLTKAQIEETQVIVSTPEKWDIVTRKAGDRLFTELVRLMIIDEIHLLSDSRGPVLESLIARAIKQSQNSDENIRIVGLSATLPNYRDVGATLRVTLKSGLFYFDQSYRPVPLEQLFCGVTQKKGVRKMMMINEILYEKVIERVSNHQMIIFVHSRRDTVRTANYLRQTAYAKNESHKILKPESESKRILESLLKQGEEGKGNKISSDDLKKVLPDGIGIHHAGLNRADRNLVEELFANRNLNILVCTATLAWGVNLPAHTVIIKGTQVYSPEEGLWTELTLQDVMQMLGRAGRPRYDQKGEGIIISGFEEIRYYLGMLNMQVPLESQMLKMLPDQLNAEIVLGSVNNIKDAVNWLGYTYLYVRMLKNPKYYSVPLEELQEDPQLLKRRVHLVHTAATILERNGLINYDRRSGTFSSTFLGKISSYYYVKYASMAIYNTNLKPNTGLIELFKIFSMSLEFKYISVREEEKIQLNKLMESVPVPIKGTIEDSTSKISVLLQAHISKLPLEGYALNVDKVFVTQSASRIMRALFEISVKRGWGQVAQKCLELAKMIDKTMWTCMNPLRQFPEIPQYVLGRLEKKEQFSWQSFYQMSPQQIGELTKFPKLGKIIYKFVHHVPRVQINAYAQPVTRSCLKVDLTIKSGFEWDNSYHGKQQPFWLFVLDCNQQNLLFSYHFTLSQKQPHFFISFIVPLFEILHPLYFIKVISDRWISSDNVLPLAFKNMILPSKFPSPNELLDLQPLPASSLPSLAKDLKISYLNQIQTQVYNAVVNSDKNCFLGASEGSGKFTLALLSISKCLENGKKAVVMLPFKSLLSAKVLALQKIFPRVPVGMTHQQLSKDSAVLLNSSIIVTNPEAWDILTRRWKARKGFEKIGLFVIDSLHLLSQNYSTMEVVISRMRYISTQIQHEPYRIIGLSASTADYMDIGEWIGAPSENIFNFHPNVRQNSVEIVFSSYDQNLRESRLHMMQKNLIYNIKHYNRNCLVFVDNKKQAKLTSLDFVSLLSTEQNPKRFKKISENQMKIFTKQISDQYLVHILGYGIGYIYEGMNEVQKEIMLKLFEIEGIGILVCTHNLKWELTSKAFIVAVMDCSYYDCRNQRWSDYSIPDMMQMMSLASTSEKDKNKGKEYTSSKFLIMCHGPKKAYYKKFLAQPYPVESSLNNNLANHLNSGISIKTIQSKEDCIDWITWTFFYRRLMKNPNFYNMQDISEEGVSTYLSQLIETTIEYMEGVKCVEVENEVDLTATNLGIICSYYYIKIETVGSFVERINPKLDVRSLLEILSEAEELKDFGYRPGQHQILGQLLVQAHESAKNKVHALLLLYLNRVPVSLEIMSQIKAILPICFRICQSLVDIISTFGFLKLLTESMKLCEMLIQAIWVGDSELLQVMDRHSAAIIEKEYNITKIIDFFDLDEQQIKKALKDKDIEKISRLCNRFPNISMTCEVVEASPEEEQVEINVHLERADDEWIDEPVICPFYPDPRKEEFWWVVVGEKKTGKVLATKRSILKKEANLAISFEKLESINKYSVYAFCDSYQGCQQFEEIDLQQVKQNEVED